MQCRRRLTPLLVVAPLLACGDPGCENAVVHDLPAPGHSAHLVVFNRDCGATTDFSTQVSILPVGQPAAGAGNVFRADTDHGQATSGPHGGPAVVPEWLAGGRLRIRYEPGARIFAQLASHDGIAIDYLRDSELRSRP